MSFVDGVANLTIRNASLGDAGRYTLVATNDAGSERVSCFINVQSKYF